MRTGYDFQSSATHPSLFETNNWKCMNDYDIILHLYCFINNFYITNSVKICIYSKHLRFVITSRKLHFLCWRTLNDSSKFSPPQMSKPLSYVPSRSKNFLSMAKRPPAMVGDHTGSAELLWRFFSRSGTTCQLNWWHKNKTILYFRLNGEFKREIWYY